jgi:hypothetical protein
MKLKPGDTVRVVGSQGTAKIRAILTNVHGALLEKRIGRFRVWNLDELRLVKRRTSRVRSCRVTIQDMDGVSHTVEVTAAGRGHLR